MHQFAYVVSPWLDRIKQEFFASSTPGRRRLLLRISERESGGSTDAKLDCVGIDIRAICIPAGSMG